MTDFAALGRTNTAGLAGRVRREVVVVNVTFGRDRVQRIELLFQLEHIQGSHAHNLGFAALKNRRTVHARQYFNLGGQLTNIGESATINAHLFSEDALAHGVLGKSRKRH